MQYMMSPRKSRGEWRALPLEEQIAGESLGESQQRGEEKIQRTESWRSLTTGESFNKAGMTKSKNNHSR